MKLDQFSHEEIQAMHDEMNEGGKLEFLFADRIISDEKDSLSEIDTETLVNGGLTQREAEIFVCAVAASARSDWKTTQLAMYWGAKLTA